MAHKGDYGNKTGKALTEAKKKATKTHKSAKKDKKR